MNSSFSASPPLPKWVLLFNSSWTELMLMLWLLSLHWRLYLMPVFSFGHSPVIYIHMITRVWGDWVKYFPEEWDQITSSPFSSIVIWSPSLLVHSAAASCSSLLWRLPVKGVQCLPVLQRGRHPRNWNKQGLTTSLWWKLTLDIKIKRKEV